MLQKIAAGAQDQHSFFMELPMLPAPVVPLSKAPRAQSARSMPAGKSAQTPIAKACRLLACDPRDVAFRAAHVLPIVDSASQLLFADQPDVHQVLDAGELPHCLPSLLRAAANSIGAREVLMHLPACAHSARSKLARMCREAGLPLVVPSSESEQHVASRPARIEDLLARPCREIDVARVDHLIAGRTVLVSGAGGSIGSVLCEQIARFRPACLLLLDQSEYSLYNLDEKLARHCPDVTRICLVADVRQRGRIEQILERFRPALVFHAAAYKHVPLLEDVNAWEAVRNNVLGTEVLGRAAMRTGVERFVLVSTDKAVNPVSVMGASKRMAEMVCQSLQQESARPCFEIVRFGNVIGSLGSVIPLFEQQIRRGDRLTLTHPEMRRYFMSVDDAARLLLQAATMGQGGEIFVMDMGQPVRLLDVARDMLHLSGEARPDERITYIGLRPGERLFEELLAPGETTRSIEHPGLHIARMQAVPEGWLLSVMQILREDREPASWRDQLRGWVPEYRPESRPMPTRA